MKRAKGPGRPKTPRKLAKAALVSVRFSAAEKRRLEQIAAQQGLALSDWVRQVLLAAEEHAK